jgi:hypothetical protein
MLEILLIVHFCKKLGNKIRAKGHSAGWYQAMFVGLWFFGEFAGAIFGVIVGLAAERGQGDPNPLFIYIFALAGAATGGFITFWIAGQLSDLNEHQRQLYEQPYTPGTPVADGAPSPDAYRGIPDDRLQR